MSQADEPKSYNHVVSKVLAILEQDLKDKEALAAMGIASDSKAEPFVNIGLLEGIDYEGD